VVITEEYHCYQLQILSNMFLSRLTIYVEEMIGDYKWGFRFESVRMQCSHIILNVVKISLLY